MFTALVRKQDQCKRGWNHCKTHPIVDVKNSCHPAASTLVHHTFLAASLFWLFVVQKFWWLSLVISMHPPSCSHHHIARFIFANAGQKVCMPHYRAHKPLISTPWCSPLSCFCQRQHFGLQWHNCQGCRRHLPYRVQQPSISEVATHVMLRSWWYVCISTTLQLMYVGLSEILVKNHEHDSTWP